MKPSFKLGLRGRLAGALALAAAVPTMLLGALAIHAAYTDVAREVVAGNLSLIRTIAYTLNEVLLDGRRALEMTASFKSIHGATQQRSIQEVAKALKELRKRFPRFTAFHLINRSGEKLYGNGPIPKGFTPKAAEAYGGYISNVYRNPVSGRPRITIVVQVREPTGVLGYLCGEMDLLFIRTLIGALKLGAGSRLLVVDNHGRPIFHSDQALNASRASLRDTHPAVDRVLASYDEGHKVFKDQQGKEWIAVYRSTMGFHEFRERLHR